MHRLLFLIILLCFSTGSILQAQIYATNTARAEVKGSVSVAPDYTGVSDRLEGVIDLDSGTVVFQLPLKTISTGNSTRDEHMLEALEAERYPNAAFRGKIKGWDATKSGTQKVVLEGDFSLHGQKKFFQIPGTIEKLSNGLKFSAAFSVFITNFGIERPSALFLKVEDRHDITVSGTAGII